MAKEKVTLLYRLGRFVLSSYYAFICKCSFEGMENIPSDGPVMLVSNHISYADPIMIPKKCKRQVHFMAKDSLFKNKLFDYVLRKIGAFPVARGTGGEDALAEAYKVLNDGKVVGIFIEGTRSKDGELLKPKTGASLIAYKTQATIVPVAITVKGGVLPNNKRRLPMLISYGKPIPFKELGMEDGSSMHCRRGAKKIMSIITQMREASLAKLEGEI